MDTEKRRGVRRLLRFLRIPLWLEYILVGGLAVVLLVLGSSVVWAALAPIPSIENFQNREVAESTKIYDRTGSVVLYDVHGAMRRTAVPLDEISPFVGQAAISVEDNTFYTNAGFRPLSFMRAMLVDIMSGSYVQGGSTITQQVVKNAMLSTQKTITRKLEEIILALRLTRIYSKDKILETYLNETAYGGTIYGVQEASQYFFGIDAKDVDLAQAAYLAALPQAPTYYSPYGNHKDRLDERKNFVLQQMLENGFITEAQYHEARAETVTFKSELTAGIKAPHFVFYILENLEKKYGADAVTNGGLKVITTLDYDLQQKAEDTITKFAPDMQKNFDASNEGLVAVDPKTGQVLAMVGSRDYFDETIDGMVNVALTHRQPGSSFKPFVYATAFEKGYTPDTVVYNLQTQFSTHCQPTDVASDTPPCYSPQNFDGKFTGPMTLRNALSQSVNVPAIKVLYLAGIKDSIQTAESMGITSLGNSDQYGLTLVLGGGEVSLLDLTGAYSVFANDGVRNPVTGVLRVEDNRGNVLEQFEDQSRRVLDQQIARQISDILSDNVARTPEFGADSPLYFPGYDVADKTGTTNDFRDVWVVGYTPGVAVGTWAGNNDNTPMQKKIAAFIIAPMWHEFMRYAIEKYPSDPFTPPAPEANPEALPQVLRGNWNSDPSLGVHSILYWVNKDSPRGPRPVAPATDPQFAYWEFPVQLWVLQNAGLVANQMAQQQAQGQIVNPNLMQNVFHITSPTAGTYVPAYQPLRFTSYAPHPESVSRVVYYLNGSQVGAGNAPPYTVSFTPLSHGSFVLRAVAEHTNGTTEEQSLMFNIQ